ncbi:MAG: cytochrome c biogenesis protein CcsA [Actinobacteria bacterium]|nr:cytochrome c biogenesis protein CcsA [Actinomycetota bacterium]
MAELLFWAVMLTYGLAACALVGEARRSGLPGRLAIWGVRAGWLAHTALLAVQAVQADGFPWSSAGGALTLFAWLVVGAYLIWGCRPRFRLLGLAVMPAAALLLVAAYAGGGIGEAPGGPSPLLALHVALMLGAFAGFALAAGLAGFYLWQERRLKLRRPGILRRRLPPVEGLEYLSARTVAVSLGLLTAGIGLGLASLAGDGGSFDAAMAVTLAAWAVFAGYLGLRRAGLHGRRAAYVNLAGFLVVALALPITHFAP